MNGDNKFISSLRLSSFNIENYFSDIWKLKPSQPQKVKLYGKEISLPRNIKTYGVPYSGFIGDKVCDNETSLPQSLETLKNDLGLGGSFWNSVLLNFYKNGDDYIGKHTDSNKNFNTKNGEYFIYIYTLYENPEGKTRKMIFRNKKDKTKIEVELKHNSLICIDKYINENYTHEIPKMKNNKNKRISLTFRHLKE